MAFTRNWDRTVVAKVISDRHVIPAQFSQLMLRVWGVHIGTQITVIGVNTFLIVFFFCVEEMEKVLKKDPWLY